MIAKKPTASEPVQSFREEVEFIITSMEAPARQQSFRQQMFKQQSFRQQSFRLRKNHKQLAAKRGDTPLHSAIRAGNYREVLRIVGGLCDEEELKKLLTSQNQVGETPLYVASESGCVDMVKELIKYYDIGTASVKAKSGYDAFHVATKQGDLEVLKVLSEALPELLMTTDMTNTTALHTAASQGHVEVVDFLLEKGSSLAAIARNNGKTALHSAARNGHLEVVEAIMEKDPSIVRIVDKKGQTALHMAVKGHSVELVDAMVKPDPCLINMVDSKGNIALHIAAKKGRAQIVHKLLEYKETNKDAINRYEETALDAAEKSGHLKIAEFLKSNGVRTAKLLTPPAPPNPARELKQTVSDIKHEVHDQIKRSQKQGRRMHHIAKRLNKMQREGINNAINSSTVVAVLIATVAFAAIFTVPGQYIDSPQNIPRGSSLGEAKIAPTPEFLIFFISDSLALFISLAVVVVQTSVVIIERKAKKQMMAIINKLMWLACVFISVAFLALSYLIVGKNDIWLAISVTLLGTGIMATTLGVMCYWVIRHRMEASKIRSLKRSSMSSRSRSRSMSMMSDTEILDNEFKKLYAV